MSVETISTLMRTYPSIDNWVNEKIDDLCESLSTFFYYLVVPRAGYLSIDFTGNTKLDSSFFPLKEDAKSRRANVIRALSVYPVINREIISYVISEIYPCSVMENNNGRDISPVSEKLKFSMKKYIEKRISSKLLGNPDTSKLVDKKNFSMTIDPIVYQLIWKYVCNCIYSLNISPSTTDGEINKMIAEIKNTTLNIRNCSMNYGFNDIMENCAFESILYILTTILDWLEESEVTNIEIQTVYNIIYPIDCRSTIEEVDNAKYTTIIANALTARGFTYTKQAVKMITGMMVEVEKYINKLTENDVKRVMNRYMAFSRPS